MARQTQHHSGTTEPKAHDQQPESHEAPSGERFATQGAIPAVGGPAATTEPTASQRAFDGAAAQPAHEVVDDKASTAGGAHATSAEYTKLAALADSGDVTGFTTAAGALSKGQRGQVKDEFVRHHKLDGLAMAMQIALTDSPYHQESTIDAGGAIYCTTAVRLEGVTAEHALTALTKTNWKDWWATSSTSGPPPSFDFVPEAPLAMIPGFHLHVQAGEAKQEGKNWRLPVKLVGSFAGEAEMYIESVDGGVVVHDTWMGMKLTNSMMQHVGGVGFWTNGHLQALRGAMAGGLLGPTGFAGLRKHLLGHK